jgi:hypothetical protein
MAYFNDHVRCLLSSSLNYSARSHDHEVDCSIIVCLFVPFPIGLCAAVFGPVLHFQLSLSTVQAVVNEQESAPAVNPEQTTPTPS